MLSKNRNIILFVILVVLVGVYWWSSKVSDKQSNYRTELLNFDTAVIDQIKIVPPVDSPEFTLNKGASGWVVKDAQKQFTADNKVVARNLDLLNGIAVKRMASKNASMHEQFAVTPDKGTLLELFSNGKKMGDLMLGKFDYFQPQNAQPDPYGRQPQGEMVFYASIPGEPAVYVIDGQVGFGIGKDMSSFRVKTLVNLDKNQITEVVMENSGQETNRLVKQGSSWLFNDKVADSAKVAQYITRISHQNGSKFAETNLVEGLPLASKIKIMGDGFPEVVLQSYQQDSVNFLVTSSQNTESVFLDNGNKLTDRLVEDDEFFHPKK